MNRLLTSLVQLELNHLIFHDGSLSKYACPRPKLSDLTVKLALQKMTGLVNVLIPGIASKVKVKIAHFRK